MKYVFDHDYHIHSWISDCSRDPEQTPERILRYAQENGLHEICLTDHHWDEDVPGAMDWYKIQNTAWINRAKPLPQAKGTDFLFGCETDMDQHMTVGIALPHYDRFDFVIIPTTHMHMVGFVISEEDTKSPALRARQWIAWLDAVLNMPLPFHKIGIAHLACCLLAPTREEFLFLMEQLPENELERLFSRAAEVGVGIELNEDDMKFADSEEDIVLRPFKIARSCGCKFYCGSDAHHPDTFTECRDVFGRAIDRLGLQESDKFHIERTR